MHVTLQSQRAGPELPEGGRHSHAKLDRPRQHDPLPLWPANLFRDGSFAAVAPTSDGRAGKQRPDLSPLVAHSLLPRSHNFDSNPCNRNDHLSESRKTCVKRLETTQISSHNLKEQTSPGELQLKLRSLNHVRGKVKVGGCLLFHFITLISRQ